MINIENQNIIEDIAQNLLVYIKEDGSQLPIKGGSVFSNSNHEPLFNKYIIGSGYLQGNFDKNVPMPMNLVEISKYNKFLMFCNVSTKNSDFIIVYASEELSLKQKSIIKDCLDVFKQFNVNVVLGIFDNEGKRCSYTVDDFVNHLNNEESVIVR